MAQVVESLPSKPKALSSNPSTTQKRKLEKKKRPGPGSHDALGGHTPVT
jgi:hypothetical protein